MSAADASDLVGDGPRPLSSAQSRMWFAAQYDADSPAYNQTYLLRLAGALDEAALLTAVREVIAAHEVLRSVVDDTEGEPRSVPVDQVPFAASVPVAGAPTPEALAAEARRPFDLRTEPPLRVASHRVADGEWLLVLTFHHIAMDAWSFGLLTAELAARYRALLGTGPAPPAPRARYADFVAWERKQDHTAGLDWWADELAGLAAPSALPVDRPRDPVAGPAGDSLAFELPAELTTAVRRFAVAARTTPFTVLCAGLQALLARVGGGEDIAVGIPVSGRDHPDFEETVGSFVNTVVVRTAFDGSLSGRELTGRVRAAVLRALDHAQVPFEQVVQRLRPERSPGGTPLIQVMVNHTAAAPATDWGPGVSCRVDEVQNGTTKFDLTLHLVEERRAIRCRFAYRADLFEADTAQRWRDWYLALLAGLTATADRPVLELPLGPEPGPAAVGPHREVATGPLHALVERSVARTPDAPAVVGPDGALSYGRLGELAGRVAARLRAVGVVPDQPVAVLCDRRTALATALLGVLRSGGCYLPLEETLPAARLRALLAASGAQAVLTTGELAPRLPVDGPRVLLLDEVADWPAGTEPEPDVDPGSLAYTIFTSGSTGQPKGVAVEHRQITHYLGALFPELDAAVPGVRSFALVSTPAADLGLTAVLGALTTGRVLHLLDAETAVDPRRFARYLGEHQVDAIKMVPSQLEMLAADAELATLLPRRLLILGGEACSWDLVRRIRRAAPGLAVQTSYGPTETTVSVLTCDVDAIPEERRHGGVPLGRPLAGVVCRVTDPEGRTLPGGMSGELWIAGPTLARGYLGERAGTEAAFRRGPDGTRHYRTGDRVRARADGMLEFLGRVDDQVKILGHRVEPGEVAAALRALPGVAAAHAQPVGGGREPRLCAWVVPAAGATPTVEELRAAARTLLPRPMLPAEFVLLDRLPLTPNGKVDRRALPLPAGPRRAAPRRPPGTLREEILRDLFAEVLGVPTVGVDDDFFALGGHSLLATRLAARIRSALGLRMTVRMLFDAPTAAELAPFLAPHGGRPPVRPMARPERVPLSGGQRALWFLHQMEGSRTGYNQCYPWRLRGPLDVQALEAAVGDVLRRHDILRTVFLEHEGVPHQRVLDAEECAPRLRVEALPADRLAARLTDCERHTFDLSSGIPVRVDLLALGPEEHVLVWTAHHIAGDGWSAGPLWRDLAHAYRERRAGRSPSWGPLPVQYADYAIWQRDVLGSQDGQGSLRARQLAYWTERLADLPERLELPWDRRPPAESRFVGEVVTFRLDPALRRALAALARDQHATVFMVLQAALAALLTRHGAGTDIPIGTPVAGRPDAALHELVGFFVNTLALRTDTSGEPTFRELLARVRETDLAAFDHQDLPFEELVDRLNPTRSLSHNPLFQVLLVFRSAEAVAPFGLSGLRVEREPLEHRIAKFDLAFQFGEAATEGPDGADPGGLLGEVEFSTDLFDRDTVVGLTRRLTRLLRAVAADPGRRIGDIDLLDAEERHRVLRAWNEDHHAAPRPTPRTVPELFRAQAARTPTAVALARGEELIRYAELDRRTDALASALLADGVRAEQRVAIRCARQDTAVVAALAVLKAGAAYALLDPAADSGDPAERLGCVLLLTDGEIPAGETRLPVRMVEQQGDTRPTPPQPPVHLDQLACLTPPVDGFGTGPAVAVTHRNLARLASATPDATPPTRRGYLLHAPPGSAAAPHELWEPLLTGGRVLLAPPGGIEQDALPDDAALTHLWLPAGLFPRFVAERPARLAGPRELRTGGDTVPAAVVERLREHCPATRIVHTTGWGGHVGFALTHPVPRSGQAPGPLPAGRPEAGVHAYVLDGTLRPVPPGVTGELYLAGEGLARGLADDRAGTATRWVANPCGDPGSRMYRPGVLARHRLDGVLELRGQADGFGPRRGPRPRPAEAEAALAEHPGVAQAAAMVRELADGERRMVAAVVARAGQQLDPDELVRWVRRALPEPFAPVGVMVLGRLPLTGDGAVRRALLPTPPAASATEGQDDDRATSHAERVLARLFAEVLGLPSVPAHGDFFGLGGSSLLVMRLVARVREELGVQLTAHDVFAGPTVAQLRPLLDATVEGRRRPPLGPRARPARLPLSPAQERLWFLHRLDGGSVAYNIPFALRLRGELDVPALRAALVDLTARHETLRTVLPEHLGAPVQRVLAPDEPPDLAIADIAEAELPARLDTDRTHRFDLETGAPLRAVLYRLGPAEHVLSLVVHHIAVDGWSLAPLWRDLAEAYAARCRGAAPGWEPLVVSYADCALWQRELVAGHADPDSLIGRQLAYWRAALADLPTWQPLPGERHGTAPTDSAAPAEDGHLTVRCGPEAHAGLARLARACGAPLSTVLHAAVAALLSRLGSGTDIVLGTAVAGRDPGALDDAVGFFVNTLVLRTDVSGDPTFRDLVARTRATHSAALSHADVPFELVVRELNPGRETGHNPLFRVMFSVSAEPPEPPRLPGLQASFQEVHAEGSKFDLLFDFVERRTAEGRPAGIECRLGHRARLFAPGTATRLGATLHRLLERVASAPDRRLTEVDILTDEDRARLTEWNSTEVSLGEVSLTRLVEEQAARTPSAIAVRCGAEELTYAQLNERADALARWLAAEGAGPERFVGLALPRDPGLVVAMLAVLKSGAAYLPIDRDQPAERISRILAEVEPVVVLEAVPAATADPPASSGPPRHTPAPWRPDHPAYLIHTSGSTGRPKGVVVTGRGIANQMAWLRRTHPLAPGEVMLSRSPVGFDASVWEIWAALVCGATVSVAPEPVAGRMDLLADYLREQGVTHTLMVPSALAGLLPFLTSAERDRLTVFAGGEALPAALVGTLGRVVNLYGPTETTVLVTSWAGTADGLDGGQAPLGRPVANTRTHVLDAALRPVPVGVPGELYIAGDQLARGYHNRPGLTAERFVADPYGPPGSRLYRSGDRARWRQDGTLEFLGRADDQVKLRGFRVEPGEVEAEFAAWPEIARAVVVARDERLVAYLVPAAPAAVPAPDEVRRRLAGVLPRHFLPADVVALEKLPLRPNGKVDRDRLPAPDRAAATGRAGPRTPGEELLCGLFAEVLGVPTVGVDDDFFALGGHSLLAVRLVHRVRGVAGAPLTLGDIFQAPTVARLARHLEGDGGGPFGPLLRLRAGSGRPPLFCLPPVIGLGWSYGGLARHLPEGVPVLALQALGFEDEGPLPADPDALVREYRDRVRAEQPRGPYQLLGWSFGGVVAHAVAVLLQQEGEDVPLLALLDSYAPEPGPGDPAPDDGRELARLHLRHGALGSLDEDRLAGIARVTAHHVALIRRHTPGVFHGDVVYLSAERDEQPGARSGPASWHRHIEGRLRVHPLSAGHYDLLRPETLPDLVAPITARLAGP
ncbi:non-ribosomal peptide synthetase [Streptomyces profundus]|uniref:non-ribosomal peptide synthetase n=1 Tax=Streptomyces profundus TaxID=2867410 RepID=UPI001D16B950|nr:non-ribosomal peptide synthetase [Streptomyces sp. MA3_2.13]UED87496.1 amino acid adenylation domain-containing protein [Streptomyces sp. MA3_2.13]